MATVSRRDVRSTRSRTVANSSIGRAERLRGEGEVLTHREVVVEGTFVAEPAHAASERATIDRREVQSEHRPLPRAQPDESREQTQEARLAGAVRAHQHGDRRGREFEVDAAQEREPTGHRDGAAQPDRGSLERRHAATGPGRRCPRPPSSRSGRRSRPRTSSPTARAPWWRHRPRGPPRPVG